MLVASGGGGGGYSSKLFAGCCFIKNSTMMKTKRLPFLATCKENVLSRGIALEVDYDKELECTLRGSTITEIVAKRLNE